jgi:hypothetical protein
MSGAAEKLYEKVGKKMNLFIAQRSTFNVSPPIPCTTKVHIVKSEHFNERMGWLSRSRDQWPSGYTRS